MIFLVHTYVELVGGTQNSSVFVWEPENNLNIADVTRESFKIHEATIQELRDQGCSVEEIFEAIAVASLFNYMDRMADSLGAPVEGFQDMMEQMQEG